jgi:hypothetical protein
LVASATHGAMLSPSLPLKVSRALTWCLDALMPANLSHHFPLIVLQMKVLSLGGSLPTIFVFELVTWVSFSRQRQLEVMVCWHSARPWHIVRLWRILWHTALSLRFRGIKSTAAMRLLCGAAFSCCAYLLLLFFHLYNSYFLIFLIHPFFWARRVSGGRLGPKELERRWAKLA